MFMLGPITFVKGRTLQLAHTHTDTHTPLVKVRVEQRLQRETASGHKFWVQAGLEGIV